MNYTTGKYLEKYGHFKSLMKIITHSKKVKDKQTKIHEENYTEINPNKT